MNWQVLRDKKTVVYFLLSFLSFIVAIVCALKDNSGWIGLIVIGHISLLFAIMRAQKITY